MVISSIPFTIVSAETKTAGSLQYVDDGYHETYWVDRNGNVVVVPLQIILEKSEYEYTGDPIKPRISYIVGTSLDKVSPRYDEHTHYAPSKFNVTYKNNTDIGTGMVYVSDKGNNITITQDFTIKRSSDKKLLQDPLVNYQVKIKKVTKASESFIIEWNNLNLKAVDYQVQYATNKKMKGAKTLRLKHYQAKSTCVQSLKKNKTYYVRVRAYTTKGKKQYTKWSTLKKVKTLKKAKHYGFPYPINVVVDEGNLMYTYELSKRAYLTESENIMGNSKEKTIMRIFSKRTGSKVCGTEGLLRTVKEKDKTGGFVYCVLDFVTTSHMKRNKITNRIFKTALKKYKKGA